MLAENKQKVTGGIAGALVFGVVGYSLFLTGARNVRTSDGAGIKEGSRERVTQVDASGEKLRPRFPKRKCGLNPTK